MTATHRTHPKDALFAGEKPFPIINTCEHFAGSEKLITKAMELQQKLAGVFDITMDCEDGAKEGQEKAARADGGRRSQEQGERREEGGRAHPRLHQRALEAGRRHPRAGRGRRARVHHDPEADRGRAGRRADRATSRASRSAGIKREIPIHVLIETHGALRDAYRIAALPWVQVLDFGLMDFVSGFHGAIASVEHALARPVRSPRDRIRQGARGLGRDVQRRGARAQRHARY